jgi:hypothetical protein
MAAGLGISMAVNRIGAEPPRGPPAGPGRAQAQASAHEYILDKPLKVRQAVALGEGHPAREDADLNLGGDLASVAGDPQGEADWVGFLSNRPESIACEVEAGRGRLRSRSLPPHAQC